MSFGSGNTLGAGGAAGWGNGITSDPFPDPFMDYASLNMPETMQLALRWCEFIFLCQGTYREATRRLLSYFITDVELQDGNDEIKEQWGKFLNETLDIKNVLHIVGLDALCFQGDTKTITRDGVFTLRELAGKTIDVLSKDGVYRPAEFKSFGTQELLEVKLSDGRSFFATPNHQWPAINCSGKEVIVPTTSLCKGYKLQRVVAPRPEKNDEYHEGVRHGFIFGDGSCYNKGKQSRAAFFGAKDAAVIPYFDALGGKRCFDAKLDRTVIHGFPGCYKQLPENTKSASYWYGFVSGFLAADGSVDTYGCALLTQKKEEVLKAVAEQLPRIGMVAGPVRSHWRKADLRKWSGPNAVYEGNMSYVTLLKQFMQADDFLIPAHRENFLKNKKESNYGRYVGVKSVTPTGRVEEVFCCTEMETHTFVLENGVQTRNCYGNSFTSVIPTFIRYLLCPGCRTLEKPLRQLMDEPVFRFKWQDYKFHATCPKCKYSGPWKFYDRPSGQHNGFRIKRWNPHDIEILWEPWTDEVKYIWRIPEEYRRAVREGKNPLVLEQVPPQVIQAVKNNNHLLFEKDFIHHMREDALAGVNNRGWGISRVLTNFRQAWYVQVLHRYNEAIALDYVIPFRLITPVPGDKTIGADPMIGMNMGGYMGQVQRMLRNRRRDPAGWHTLPFPVQYQAIGGDASKLAPKDLLDQGNEELLNNIGIPAELYRGSLTMQAAPAALRLFEASNSSVPHNFNAFLRFIIRKVSGMLRWEPVTARLMKVTHADDANRQMSKLQLAAGGQVSQTTGLKAVGLEYKDEIRQMMDDQRFQAEQQGKLQEQMEQAGQMKEMMQQGQGGQPGQPGQQGGQPAQGGAPGQGGTDAQGNPMAPQSVIAGLPQGPNQQTTPEEMLSRAQYVASQLMGMPESQKDSELIKLKKVDPNLHAIVSAQMKDMKQQMKTQGGAAMQAQVYGKQAAAPEAAASVVQKAASLMKTLGRSRRVIEVSE